MRTALVVAVAMLMLVPAVSAGPGPDLDRVHTDVYIPEYQACLWKGSWKPLVSTPVVTVWHYTCDDPDS